jgi:ATP-dependent exoDNAse (exonuclease V) beta subunit
VAAASALIERNPDRLPKRLRSDQAGPQLQVWACPDGAAEARAIASEAAALIDSGTSPASIAVLCRTNAIARPVAAALSALGLPHALTGGHGFHDRPEVKDLIALLRVLRDPDDVVALARAMTRPPANLDQASVLGVLRDRGSRPALEALRAWQPAATLAGRLERFAAETRRFDVRDLFFELIEDTGYLEVLNASLEAGEAERATANVSRFAETIAEFCEESPDHSLENYMRHLELVLLSGEDEEPAAPEAPREAIQVTTIHQAKGLEFDVVFVPSLVEGRLPQTGRTPRFELPPAVLEPLVRGREDVIAEERRLLYVAMTRAKKTLHLTWGAHYEGGRRWRESRFVQEVREAGSRSVLQKAVEGCPAPAAAPPRAATPRAGDVQLSYSGIAAYLDCPRQYWYRYEQRLPAVQSAEAVHGVILHDVLRRAGELRRAGGAVTASRLRSMLAEAWAATPFPDERREPTFLRNGAAQLEAYRKKGGLDGVPAYLEHPFQVEVDGWTLRGVIDRIDRTGSGWSIVDYKSGRPVARRKRDLQLALYALGATSALALDPVELDVVYLASGESVRIEKPAALLSEARAEGSRAAEGIRSGAFDAKPDRRRCRLCPYRLACADAL